MQFLQFSEEIFCKFSKILRRPGASAPGPPTKPTPLKVFPPPEILAATQRQNNI